MAMTEEEKNKLAAEMALLEQEEMQTRINRGFEVENPVSKEDEELKFKPIFPDEEHWKKILKKYEEQFPDEKPDEDGCMHFPSAEAAETFFRELAADKVEFLATQLVNGKPVDNHMFSCGTGELFHGSFKDIHKQLNNALETEKNPELIAKLSQGIEKISARMPNENATISMKDRLKASLPRESAQEQEEEQQTSTLPNPFRTKPKPTGAI